MKTVAESMKAPLIPYQDREYILQHILKTNRSGLYLSWNKPLTKKQRLEYKFILDQYKTGKPLAYILKKTNFFSQTFQIKNDVFIPRPETEVLVEKVLSYHKNQNPRHFMDWGSGSGSIGLSLLSKWKHSHLTAVDVHQKAIECIKENASIFKLSKRISTKHQEVLDLKPKDFPHISLITANPPYIAFDDPFVEPSVIKYEPYKALFSSSKGLGHIRSWLNHALHFLAQKGGSYFFEIGYDQAEPVTKLLEKKRHLIDRFTLYSDYQGHQRVVHVLVKPYS